MRRVPDLFDLKTNLRIRFDVLGLHTLSGKEIEFLAVVGIVHWQDVRPVVTRASQMAEALALKQRVHLRR
jgi:hypothetical protein